MNVIIGVLGFIIMFIVAPAFIGILWIIFVGGPFYGGMKLWEYCMIFFVNPIFKTLNKIPFLGRLISAFIAIPIALFSLGVVIMIYFSTWMVLLHSFGN